MKKKLLFIAVFIIGIIPIVHAQLPFIPQQRQKNSSNNSADEKLKYERAVQFEARRQLNMLLWGNQNNFLGEQDANSTSNATDPCLIYGQKLTIKQRDTTVKRLKKSMKNTFNCDSMTLIQIADSIQSIKTCTTNDFLSKYKPAKPFFIFGAYRHNIDLLNEYIYGQANVVDIFQTMEIQYAGKSAGINTEIASVLFGPIRMGIGANFQTTNDTAKDNLIKADLQKIIANKGTINLNLGLPLVYYRSRKERFHFSAFAQINNGINPGIDTTNAKSNYATFYYTNQSGIDLHFDLTSNDQKATLAVDLPFYYAFGLANAYEQLGIADYSILKIRIGLAIANKISLNITGPLWSSSKTLQSIPFTIGFNFSPSQIAKSSNN